MGKEGGKGRAGRKKKRKRRGRGERKRREGGGRANVRSHPSAFPELFFSDGAGSNKLGVQRLQIFVVGQQVRPRHDLSIKTHADIQTDRQTDTNRHTYRYTDTHRQTRTDTHTDTHTQTDTHTDTHTHASTVQQEDDAPQTHPHSLHFFQMSVCLYIYLSVYLSTYLSICYLSICYLSICYLSIYLSICVHLSSTSASFFFSQHKANHYTPMRKHTANRKGGKKKSTSSSSVRSR